MDEEKIEIVSNIKAIGWTTFIVFGVLGYFIFTKLILGMFFMKSPLFQGDFDGSEVSGAAQQIVSTANTILWVYWAAVIFIVVKLYGASQLLKLKRRGLVIFHTTSTMLVGLIFMAIFYLVLTFNPIGLPENDEVNKYFSDALILEIMSSVIILLIIIWIVVKANILLGRNKYRNEFV